MFVNKRFKDKHMLFLLLLIIGSTTGMASRVLSKDLGHDEAQQLQADGVIVPLEQVLEQARTKKPGRLLELELERKRGMLIYEIEIVDKEGLVWEFEFDAATGELIQLKQDD